MTSPAPNPVVPLCVDLDGTLIRSDVLWESLMQLIKRSPLFVFALPFWWLRGRAHLKRQIASRVELDATVFPYRREFLEFLRAEHQQQRPLILVTAADRQIAQKVAQHLGLFAEVLGSDGVLNLRGRHKARCLTQRFGLRGFDYAGDSAADLEVWRVARQAIVTGAGERLVRQARKVTVVSRVFNDAKPGAHTLLRAIRVHQWVKNLIVFVPLLTSHRLADGRLFENALLAFFAFSFCASGAYLTNDLLDIEADRHHATKRFRPFAAGEFTLPFGAALALVCLGLSLAAAVCLSWNFIVVLAVYFALTSGYSWRLKQVPILDVFVLAGLYTIRLVAGHAATGIENSFWLLAFSMFIFLSLALAKRFTELQGLRRQNRTESKGRGYQPADLELVAMLGIVSGFLAVLVMVLYVHSQEVMVLYRHPDLLLLVCPFMLYWISRVWFIAHRGKMQDDPIVFALKDGVSYLVAGLILAVLWVAAG
jgi:4-hydroxybenzoate polyprenyltransferase/phosphoserine phosphatase